MDDSRWSSHIDQMLGDLFKETDVKNLPGTGKPLDLSQNPYEPAEMRMANRLLKENGLAPDWILEGRELDSLYEALMARVKRMIEKNQTAVSAVLTAIENDVKTYNKRVLTYNLKVPAGIAHKRTIDLKKEISR